MAMALDGSVSGIMSTVNSKVVALSTTFGNDIIIVIVANEKATDNGSFTTVSSVTSPGLNFNFLDRVNWSATLGNATKQDLEVWWAWSPGILTSQNITVNIANTGGGAQATKTDDSWVVAFGVSGVPFKPLPWDTDASLPKHAVDTTGVTTAVQATGVSTQGTQDFVIVASTSAQNVAYDADTGAGYTQIAAPNNQGGSLFQRGLVQYKVISSALSNQTVKGSVITGTGGNWGMLVIALSSIAQRFKYTQQAYSGA